MGFGATLRQSASRWHIVCANGCEYEPEKYLRLIGAMEE
jgi:hypothetical protein